MLYLRDLPKYEAIEQRSKRYPQVDAGAVQSFLVLLRVASDVLEAFEQFLARHGMSQGRFSVLMLLNRDPDQPLSPSDLANKCGVTRATMTGLLDGLERERLIKREADRNDRRMLLIQLTTKGRKVLDGMLPDYYHRIALLMQDLSNNEKHQLVELLGKVNGGISAVLSSNGNPA